MYFANISPFSVIWLLIFLRMKKDLNFHKSILELAFSCDNIEYSNP